MPSADHPVSPDGPRRPALLVFDVNETLSDMAPMAQRFEEVGAPGHLAATWFSGLLRDGFALTVIGENPKFADLAAGTLRGALAPLSLDRDVDAAVGHVLEGIAALEVHPDVAEGLSALSDLGIRLVTLSNGSTSVAEQLLGGAGLRDHFEALLSVEDAPAWKPAATAYAHALGECGVDPEDAMLVAVHPWDTAGAQRGGLAAAWVNRHGASYPEYFGEPDLEVRSLVDLARRLG